jgi:hypothetical protein
MFRAYERFLNMNLLRRALRSANCINRCSQAEGEASDLAAQCQSFSHSTVEPSPGSESASHPLLYRCPLSQTTLTPYFPFPLIHYCSVVYPTNFSPNGAIYTSISESLNKALGFGQSAPFAIMMHCSHPARSLLAWLERSQPKDERAFLSHFCLNLALRPPDYCMHPTDVTSVTVLLLLNVRLLYYFWLEIRRLSWCLQQPQEAWTWGEAAFLRCHYIDGQASQQYDGCISSTTRRSLGDHISVRRGCPRMT